MHEGNNTTTVLYNPTEVDYTSQAFDVKFAESNFA